MSIGAKSIVKSLAALLISPVLVIYGVLAFGLRIDVFPAFSQGLSLIPGKIGSYARAVFMRLTSSDSSMDCRIGFGTIFSQRDTSIGEGVYIGPQCNIGSCRIGRKTLVASGVHILSGKHQHNATRLDVPIQDQPGTYRRISIGIDCWIGNGAIVMDDIGNHSIVGAGSVVTKPIPDFAIAVGNPARVIGSRKSDDGAEARSIGAEPED